VAVVASHPIALPCDVISESNARASNSARLRHSKKSVLLRTVGKEEGIFDLLNKAGFSIHLCEVRSECDVDCVLSSED